MDLTTLTTPIRTGDRSFRATIPDGWQQGRGAFGGITLALLARAIEGAGERPLRSLSAELCAPVLPGEVEILLTPVRVGASSSTISARLVAGEEVLAHAAGVLGRARATDLVMEAPWTAPPPWRDTPVVPFRPPLAPVFTQHLEYRPLSPAPFSSSGEVRASGWVRPLDPGPARDVGYLAALSDAWYPSFLMALPAQRPIATVSTMLEIVGSLEGLDPGAPLFHEGVTPILRDGHAVELRSLHGEDGRLVALNQQLLVVIN